MKTNTKYFGEIDYEEDEILTFPKGVYGFEEEHRFLLLPFAGGENTLLSLQSLDTPQLAFVMVDPFALDPGYAPELQPEELRQLNVADSHDLYYYAMCVVKDPVSDSTVNLRCPVAINGDTCQGLQVIMEDEQYSMRHPLSEFGKGDGAVC